MYVCMYTNIQVHTYKNIYTYTYTNIHIYTNFRVLTIDQVIKSA